MNREMFKDKILVVFEYLKRNVPNKLFFKFEGGKKMTRNLWIRFFFRLCRTTSACHTHTMNKLERKSCMLFQQIYIYICINKIQAVLASRNQYRKHEVTVHSSEECSPGSVVTSLNSVANDCWLHVYTDEISRDLCS